MWVPGFAPIQALASMLFARNAMVERCVNGEVADALERIKSENAVFLGFEHRYIEQ